ncbi:MAG: hypothetical protein CML02_02100 [Pseudooceanicola sp.]|nr:hypothetical protein [Pseudooceanicola sp.]
MGNSKKIEAPAPDGLRDPVRESGRFRLAFGAGSSHPFDVRRTGTAGQGRGAMDIKDEVAEYKRQRILNVAMTLFDRHGYAQTTIEMMSQELGVTKPFVYSYFKNKSEILAEICLISLTPSMQAAERAVAEYDTPTTQLRAAIEGVVLAVIDNQKSVNIFDREEKFQDEATRKVVLEYQGNLTRMLTRIVVEGNKRGEFDCPDVHSAVFAMGGIASWIRRWYSPGGRMTREEVARAQGDIALRIVAARDPG